VKSAGDARKNFFEKIQWIYNEKCAAITIQAIAKATENPSTQKQWKTMEITMEKTMRRATKQSGDGLAWTSAGGGAGDPHAVAGMKKPADTQGRATLAKIRD
jgi:hypothetical protein